MPRVSVIIPTYNSGSLLVEAVESVLAQTYKDFEILVIDDGSTDDTARLLENYRGSVRYLRQKNGGVSSARNYGIAESKGDYVAFLDADDTWFPEKLEKQMQALKQEREARVCYSGFMVTTVDLHQLGIGFNKRWGRTLEDLLVHGNVVGNTSVIVAESSLIKSVGGFDLELSQCADWDMFVRLAAHSEFLFINEPLVNYRQHGSNMSRNAALLEKDSLRVLEKGFAMKDLPIALQTRRRSAFARNYMVLSGTYFRAGLYLDFARCAALAVAMDVRQAVSLAFFPARLIARSRLAGRKTS